jgi:hypothetical protein
LQNKRHAQFARSLVFQFDPVLQIRLRRLLLLLLLLMHRGGENFRRHIVNDHPVQVKAATVRVVAVAVVLNAGNNMLGVIVDWGSGTR